MRMLFPSKTLPCLTTLGIFLLLLQSGSSQLQSDSVFQSPTRMEIQEGQSAILDCNFTTLSSSPDLFWYRQYMGREPQRILNAYKRSGQEKLFVEGKFSTTFFAENKSVPLKIEGVSLEDGAVYFCALSPTVSQSPFCIHTESDTGMLRSMTTTSHGGRNVQAVSLVCLHNFKHIFSYFFILFFFKENKTTL